MLAQASWGQGTDCIMRRDRFSINMCIYSLVLLIHVFVKMCICARKVSGTSFAKVISYIFMRKPNFEVNPEGCIIIEERLHQIYSQEKSDTVSWGV